jgi:hypothetical protein
MKARRGGALFMAPVVMIFFAMICGVVIGMAQTNVTYYSFFERRGILEQATQTFAEALAGSVKANAATWWPNSGKEQQGRGKCRMPAEEDLPGDFAMKFTYVISPDKNIYTLFVQGEYDHDPPRNDIIWGVSVDIDLTSSADVWSKIVRIRKEDKEE